MARIKEIEVKNKKIGVGTLIRGMGIIEGRNEINIRELNPKRCRLIPWPTAVPDIGGMGKNVFEGFAKFSLNREKFLNFAEENFKNSEWQRMDFDLEGGSGGVGALFLGLLGGEYFPRLTGRILLGHESFSLAKREERERRRINMIWGLAPFAWAVEEVPSIRLEIFTVLTLLDLYNTNDLIKIDEKLEDLDTLIELGHIDSNCSFDKEDIMNDPKFRYRTYGFKKINLGERVENLGNEVIKAVENMRLFFDYGLIFGDVKDEIAGEPFLLIVGPDGVVQEVAEDLNQTEGELDLQSLKEMIEGRDRKIKPLFGKEEEEETGESAPKKLYRKAIPLALKDPSSAFIVAIFPLREEKVKEIFKAAKAEALVMAKEFMEGKNDSLRMKIFREMLNNARFFSLRQLFTRIGVLKAT